MMDKEETRGMLSYAKLHVFLTVLHSGFIEEENQNGAKWVSTAEERRAACQQQALLHTY